MGKNEETNRQLIVLLEWLRTAASAGSRRAIINEFVSLSQPLIEGWRRALTRCAPLLEWDDIQSVANLAIFETMHNRADAGESASVVGNPAGWMYQLASRAVANWDSTPAASGGATSMTQMVKQRFANGVVRPALTQLLQRTPSTTELADAADEAWRARRPEGNEQKAGHIIPADLKDPYPMSIYEIEELADDRQLDPLEQLIAAEERSAAVALLACIPDDARELVEERFGYDPRTRSYLRIDQPKPFREVGLTLGISKYQAVRQLQSVRTVLRDVDAWDRELAMAG